MTIKARTYTETVKALKFLKGMTKKEAEAFLLNNNILEFDDCFILMNEAGEIAVKLWIVGEPREIEVKF